MMHNPDFTPRRAKKPGFINIISTIVHCNCCWRRLSTIAIATTNITTKPTFAHGKCVHSTRQAINFGRKKGEATDRRQQVHSDQGNRPMIP